jgi:competence protein ComEC
MPMGILGIVTYPFGFDDVFWRLMGHGIDWMIVVSVWVTSLPGAVGRVAAFGTGPLLLATAALLLLCLMRTRLRWSGLLLAAVAIAWVVLSPRPDIYVAGDGQAAALRGADGRLSLLHSGRDTFAVKEWLAADADARLPGDKTLGSEVRCDDAGCVGTLRDGRLAALSLAAEAFAEDCVRAAVVISARELPSGEPGDCQAMLIDRRIWRERGALALRLHGSDFEVSAARPAGESRPWLAPPRRDVASAPQRPIPRDARPPASGLEANDQ